MTFSSMGDPKSGLIKIMPVGTLNTIVIGNYGGSGSGIGNPELFGLYNQVGYYIPFNSSDQPDPNGWKKIDNGSLTSLVVGHEVESGISRPEVFGTYNTSSVWYHRFDQNGQPIGSAIRRLVATYRYRLSQLALTTRTASLSCLGPTVIRFITFALIPTARIPHTLFNILPVL